MAKRKASAKLSSCSMQGLKPRLPHVAELARHVAEEPVEDGEDQVAQEVGAEQHQHHEAPLHVHQRVVHVLKDRTTV